MQQEFSYLAPTTLEDLYTQLDKHAPKASLLAGGTDLLVEIHNNFKAKDVMIDVKKVAELSEIEYSKKKGLIIGSGVTCIDLINDPAVKRHYPILADAAGRIGSIQLRNRATIGGNLCTASPCADMGCSLLAMGAEVEIGSVKGTRTIALKDYFTGPKKTQIKDNEVLLRIIVPADMAGAKAGMRKLKRIKGHDLSLVSAVIVRTNKVLRAGFGSCGPTPVVTEDLPASAKPDAIKKAAYKVVSPIDDVRASKDYRLFMVGEYIDEIFEELGGRKK